ncbi:glycosyltransferase involved in cell wall biosynthesis [Providencia alcalifaciens]|uniref:Glycosyltransferase involved in cell wall biosynthesis n=1 Tax=Providencia alcalifaciens TaxID=126385 RepID=A0A4V2V396_9GAMM|nr:glycosyltransferase [Providencia alcalifaciens]TCT30367.1 glycosyltransferase involved in cell wall biosynthesis [Providencia alcalifaciens]
MKVLLIDVNCKKGSTGKIVYELYSELKEQGHEAAICYGRGDKISEKNIYKTSSDIETIIHAGMSRLTGYTGYFSPFSTKRIINIIDSFNPDVIHLHELHGYYVNIYPLLEYIKKKKIKTIWTFHCEFMYTGKCGHSFECEKWKTGCHHCPQLNNYPRSLYFDRTEFMYNQKKDSFSNYHNLTIVTPSSWLAERTKISFLHEKKIKIIHNGINNKDIFKPIYNSSLYNKYNLYGKKIILSIAPNIMSYTKGGEKILDIARKYHDQNVIFLLIGNDDEIKNLPKNVIAIGKIKDQNLLAEFYSIADLFLICSKRENFPTTCLEALSCGTPIIGFNNGGTAETAPGNLGFFVEDNDIDALVEFIKNFTTGKTILASPQECRNFAVTNYSTENMLKQYIELYN